MYAVNSPAGNTPVDPLSTGPEGLNGTPRRRIVLAVNPATAFGRHARAGDEAAVNERANSWRWPRGSLRYALAMLRELGSFRLAFLAVFPKVFSGRQTSHPAVEIRRVRSVRLAADNVVTHADGERIGLLPLDIDVAPGALRVLA